LTQSAIDESWELKGLIDFNKEAPIYMELSKMGHVNDWGKYVTEPFYTPMQSVIIKPSPRNLTASVHFYKNRVTGEVYYGRDFKIKLDDSGNTQQLVSEFLNSLPPNWRINQ
jgi:hypothetical protein